METESLLRRRRARIIELVRPFSLYLHIPYCDSKCPYCDFNSYAVKRWPERDYCQALIAEMTAYAAQPAWRDGAIQSVFFGATTSQMICSGVSSPRPSARGRRHCTNRRINPGFYRRHLGPPDARFRAAALGSGAGGE